MNHSKKREHSPEKSKASKRYKNSQEAEMSVDSQMGSQEKQKNEMEVDMEVDVGVDENEDLGFSFNSQEEELFAANDNQAPLEVPLPASSASVVPMDPQQSDKIPVQIDLTNTADEQYTPHPEKGAITVKKEPLRQEDRERLLNMSYEEAASSNLAEEWEELKDMEMLSIHGELSKNQFRSDQFDRLQMEVIGKMKIALKGKSGFDWRVNWESVRVAKSEDSGDYIVSMEVFGETTAKTLKEAGLPIKWIEMVEEVARLEKTGAIRHRKNFAIFGRPISASKEKVKRIMAAISKTATLEDFDLYLHADWTAAYFEDSLDGRAKAYSMVQASISSPFMIESEAIVFGLPYRSKKNLPTLKIMGWKLPARAPESRKILPLLNRKLASDCSPSARIFHYEVIRNRVAKFQGYIFAYVLEEKVLKEAASSLSGLEIGREPNVVKLQVKPTKGTG